MSEPKCLSEFLRDAYRNDTYELKLRLFSVDNNAVSFYLHPIGKDGDTADYYVVGNLTFPAQGADGVKRTMAHALIAANDGFKDPMPDFSCPKCSSVYDIFERPWFMPIAGGMQPHTDSGPAESWVIGVTTCPHCGHQWEVGS